MRENALQALETDERTEKRAQSEAFEFAVAGDVVRVTARSNQHPDEHTERVQLDERGVPSSCTCKADESYPGACKHMTAVAIREPLLEAARAARKAPRVHAVQKRRNPAPTVVRVPRGAKPSARPSASSSPTARPTKNQTNPAETGRTDE